MTEEELTAYHESGHAVMACIEGGAVKRVSIVVDEGHSEDISGIVYGDTKIAWPMGGVSAKGHMLREVRTALAGSAAERIYSGDTGELRITRESSYDWLYASKMAEPYISDQTTRTEFLVTQAEEIQGLFSLNNVWAAIAAVADELLAHEVLDEEQLQTLLAFWIGRIQ